MATLPNDYFGAYSSLVCLTLLEVQLDGVLDKLDVSNCEVPVGLKPFGCRVGYFANSKAPKISQANGRCIEVAIVL